MEVCQKKRIRGRFKTTKKREDEVERDSIRIAMGVRDRKDVYRVRKMIKAVLVLHNVSLMRAWAFQDSEKMRRCIEDVLVKVRPEFPLWNAGVARVAIMDTLVDAGRTLRRKLRNYKSLAPLKFQRRPPRPKKYAASVDRQGPATKPAQAAPSANGSSNSATTAVSSAKAQVVTKQTAKRSTAVQMPAPKKQDHPASSTSVHATATPIPITPPTKRPSKQVSSATAKIPPALQQAVEAFVQTDPVIVPCTPTKRPPAKKSAAGASKPSTSKAPSTMATPDKKANTQSQETALKKLLALTGGVATSTKKIVSTSTAINTPLANGHDLRPKKRAALKSPDTQPNGKRQTLTQHIDSSLSTECSVGAKTLPAKRAAETQLSSLLQKKGTVAAKAPTKEAQFPESDASSPVVKSKRLPPSPTVFLRIEYVDSISEMQLVASFVLPLYKKHPLRTFILSVEKHTGIEVDLARDFLFYVPIEAVGKSAWVGLRDIQDVARMFLVQGKARGVYMTRMTFVSFPEVNDFVPLF